MNSLMSKTRTVGSLGVVARAGLGSSVSRRSPMHYMMRSYRVPVARRKVIPVYPPVESKALKPQILLDTISKGELDNDLDSQGWRRDLIKKKNPNAASKVEAGDIVRIVYDTEKCSYDPFVGYVLSVDRKRLIQDASLLLRNQVAKTMVEVRIPIFSPLIKRIDIMKKNDGKRQRNKHYYIRGTKLDVSNLENKLRRKN